MRSITLLPLATLVAAAAGCRSEVREQGVRSVPQRDLTLVTQTAQVQVASPVEMQQLRIQPRTRRLSKSAARIASGSRFSHEPKVILAALAAPMPIPTPAEPVADPTPASDRELSPGKTVTVIPASSGPSAGSGTADEAPPDRGRTMVARGGGTCRGRGRGPGRGNAPVPRPDFR